MSTHLPRYPDSAALEKHHKEYLDAALVSFPPVTSEMTFTNLFAWRKAYGLSVSRRGEYILVRSQTPQRVCYFPAIGPDRGAGDMMEAVMRDTGASFIRVPEAHIESLAGTRHVQVVAERDSFDYVYAVSDLVTLAGRKYDGKRNLIKKFKATHRYEYRPLDRGLLDGCLDFHDEWCQIKDCASDVGLMAESDALREIISSYEAFGLTGAAITVEGRVRAFAVAERLNAQTMVVHILKAHADAKGLYQCMLNEFLSREAGGYAYVNLEQDLGIAGLRKAKESYYPRYLVTKFTVSLSPAHALKAHST